MKTVISLAFAGLLLSSTAAIAADAPSRTSATGSGKVGVQATTTVAPNKNIGNKATSTLPVKDHTIGMETIGEAKDKPQGPNQPPPPPPPDPPNTKVMQSKTMTH